jgi:hypothetical protein
VIEYLVDYSRVLAGGRRPFDEAPVRELVRRDVERAHNFAATQNHNLIADDGRSHEPLSSIVAPTLVIHGTADPLFPLEHGQALAEGDPRRKTADPGGSRSRRRASRLGNDRPGDPRAHRLISLSRLTAWSTFGLAGPVNVDSAP